MKKTLISIGLVALMFSSGSAFSAGAQFSSGMQATMTGNSITVMAQWPFNNGITTAVTKGSAFDESTAMALVVPDGRSAVLTMTADDSAIIRVSVAAGKVAIDESIVFAKKAPDTDNSAILVAKSLSIDDAKSLVAETEEMAPIQVAAIAYVGQGGGFTPPPT